MISKKLIGIDLTRREQEIPHLYINYQKETNIL